ncbi:MAG: hypothetical protein ACRDN6_00185 [Gaiellaceae bacterium]
MKRQLLLAFAVALTGPTPAATAKEDPAVRGLMLCGATACRTITDRAAVQLVLGELGRSGPVAGPAGPAAFFSVDVLASSYGSEWYPRGYYVPSAGLVRTTFGHIAAWRRLGRGAALPLRAATRGLRPFPRPRLSGGEVDRRPVRGPATYAVLYSLRGKSARDPAGRPPSQPGWGEGYDLWARYFARVRRHWIPVSLWTSRPSPWGDGANFVWISRRGSLLKRDGEVLQIAPALAPRVRRGDPLR